MIAVPHYETSNFAFSNFSAYTITFNGVKYPTAEHAFHAQKFDDEEKRRQILNCGSPLAAWELARKLKPQRRADWNDVKVGILADIVRAKVDQHPDVKNALLATGTEEIVEVNPNDDFWGSGADGNGQNQMGKILMKIREELRS